MVCIIIFFPPDWSSKNLADISRLRSEHHICGILTGTLPHLSQQNVFLGLPLVLMPEEVVLLVEKGIRFNLLALSRSLIDPPF